MKEITIKIFQKKKKKKNESMKEISIEIFQKNKKGKKVYDQIYL